jgi:nucleotide-binding universal stress UspA family protein
MFPLAKILLPVDFSERCLGAARYGEVFAAHFGGELSLVHVLEPLRYELSALEFGGVAISDLAAHRAAGARAQLDSFMREELGRVRVRRVILEGDPARRIVEYAHDERVNLIAMPTHGYGPFRRFILGSVTAKVLHDADCPVLTGVHMEQAPSTGAIALRTVVCAVDLGPQSRKTLSWAAELAGEFGARLALVHAVPCIESRPGEYFDRELAADLSKGAREELEKLAGEARVEPEIVVDGGDPPQVVCRAAERFQGDMLVIGRGSAAGLFGRLRTNAYAIIRQSPCAVVSV